MGSSTMTNSDFSPADAEGLAAWFARAESHATRLRRRLATLGDLWRDPPEPVRGSPVPGLRRGEQVGPLGVTLPSGFRLP
jgi:ferric-dicitrate binding protein FerR (iron transport regulator)